MTEFGMYGERLAESGLRVFARAVEESAYETGVARRERVSTEITA